MEEYKHEALTSVIIGCFYDVYNELGYGFLEKVYENALMLELRSEGFVVEKQKQIDVFFKGEKVGEYFADLVVDDSVIIELKAAEYLRKEHEAQLVNYLKATDIGISLLLNFGKKPEVRRKIFSNV